MFIRRNEYLIHLLPPHYTNCVRTRNVEMLFTPSTGTTYLCAAEEVDVHAPKTSYRFTTTKHIASVHVRWAIIFFSQAKTAIFIMVSISLFLLSMQQKEYTTSMH